MLTAQEIVTRRISRNIIFPIILFFLLTIGNYSFFRYSAFGDEASSILRIFPYIRILLPVWVVLYAFKFSFNLSSKIIKDNLDVLLLTLSWFISSITSLDSSSYLLYGTWTLFSFLAVLLFVSYTAILGRHILHFFHYVLETIWIGNMVIFFLGFVSLLLIRPGSGPYNILFSSNTFWAFPSMVLGIVAIVRIRFTSETKKKYLFLFIYLLTLYLVYISARRTPLFTLLISPILLYMPLRLPYIALLSSLLFITIMLANSVEIKDITELLPDSYAKYRIERMMGSVKGRQETSLHDRQTIWKIYMESFYENPVMGAGLAANERITEQINRDLEGFSAHNTFIGMLVETGMLGALIFVIFLYRSFIRLSQLKKSLLQIYLVLLAPTLIINWMEYNLIPGQIFFLYSIVIWMLPRGLSYLTDKGDFANPSPQN